MVVSSDEFAEKMSRVFQTFDALQTAEQFGDDKMAAKFVFFSDLKYLAGYLFL